MQLYDYQVTGAEWLSSRIAGLLADEPGLGKTIQAIEACDCIYARTVLVLCQAVGKSHWREKFSQLQRHRRNVFVVSGTSQTLPLIEDHVVIVNFDVVSRADSLTMKALLRRKWDVLIVDEGHALKSRTSKRTATVYGKKTDKTNGLAANAERTWVLTGTPAPNNPSELYPHLRALAPELITVDIRGQRRPLTEDEFVQMFCLYRDTPFGRQITGGKNLDRLRTIIAPFMLRRRKSDVLKDLPSLTFDTLVVNANDAKVPDTLLRELGQIEMLVAENMSFAKDMAAGNTPDLAEILKGLRTDVHLATQRRLVGQVKAEIAVRLVSDEIKGTGTKIILFAHHQQVIDRLVSGLSDEGLGVVKIDGRDSSKDRDIAITEFMTDPQCQVFVGQLTAAGTSITLTSASNVLFVEASWVPSDNVQAACRAHRIGQKDGVLARFLTLEGSLDKQIMTALARKARDLAVLIDNEDPTLAASASPFPEAPEPSRVA